MNFIDTIKTKDGKSLKMITRPGDLYVNATEMCKSAGKNWSDYFRLSTTKEFIDEMTSLGMTRKPLTESITTGINENRGSWVHSRIAIDLASWISPRFRVHVTDIIERYIKGEITTEESINVSKVVSGQQKNIAGFLTSSVPSIVQKFEGWFYVRVVNPFYWNDDDHSIIGKLLVMTRFIIKFGIALHLGKRSIDDMYKDDHGYFLYAIQVTDKQHAAHIESIMRSEFRNMTVGTHKEYIFVDKLLKYYQMKDDKITQENYEFLASVLYCDALNRLAKFYPEYADQYGVAFQLKDDQNRLTSFLIDPKAKSKACDLDTMSSVSRKLDFDDLKIYFQALQATQTTVVYQDKPKPIMYDFGCQVSGPAIDEAVEQLELSKHQLQYGGYYGMKDPVKSRTGLRIQKIDANDHKKVLQVFDGISHAAVDSGLKRKQISDAIRDNRILHGFRFRRLEENEDANVVPDDFPPNSTEIKKTGQPLAKLDHRGESILAVYDTQRAAAEDHDIESSALCNAIRRKRKSAGFFWKWWDECDDQMRKKYEDTFGIYKRKGPRRDSEVHQIDPNNGDVIRIFESIADAAETLLMSPDRISKACKDGNLFRSWRWRIVKHANTKVHITNEGETENGKSDSEEEQEENYVCVPRSSK